MIENLQQLLDLNLEVEGCIRILMARESDVAEDLLRHKIAQMQTLCGTAAPTETLPEPAPQTNIEPAQLPEPEPEPEVEEKPEPLPEPVSLPEPEPLPVAVPTPEVPRLETVIAQKESQNFAKAFTINDRYRFTRELFNGDKESFDMAIRRLEAMESLSDAYDYFLNELNWDVDQPEVADFLAIVANHFNNSTN